MDFDSKMEAEDAAMRFLTDFHGGDRALIEGWRRNADRRWCLTLQFVMSLVEVHSNSRQ